MKKLLVIFALFASIQLFGQTPDSTYLQWIDGDWVTEVNPNVHPELKDRDSGPVKVYNRLTGEYFIWNPSSKTWSQGGGQKVLDAYSKSTYVYVSNYGNDTTAEIGNASLPFKNLLSAIDSLDPELTHVTFVFYEGDYEIDLEPTRTLNPFDTTVWLSYARSISLNGFNDFNNFNDYIDGDETVTEPRVLNILGEETVLKLDGFSGTDVIAAIYFRSGESNVKVELKEIIFGDSNRSNQNFIESFGGDISVEADYIEVGRGRLFFLFSQADSIIENSNVYFNVNRILTKNSDDNPFFWIGGVGEVDSLTANIIVNTLETRNKGGAFSGILFINSLLSNSTINFELNSYLRSFSNISTGSETIFKWDTKSSNYGNNFVNVDIGRINIPQNQSLAPIITLPYHLNNDILNLNIGHVNVDKLNKFINFRAASSEPKLYKNSTLNFICESFKVSEIQAKAPLEQLNLLTLDSSIINFDFGNFIVNERNNWFGNTANLPTIDMGLILQNHSILNLNFDYLYTKHTNQPLVSLNLTIDSLDRSIAKISGTYVSDASEAIELGGDFSKKVYFKDCTFVCDESSESVISASPAEVIITNCYSNTAPSANITQLVDSIVVDDNLKYIK